MLLHILKGKAIGLRAFFRQLKTMVFSLMIIYSYWLIKPNLASVYYLLTAFVIIALLLDHHRPKKTLASLRIKPIEIGIMIIYDLYVAGMILITGGPQSPYISVVIIPIILFSIEYGIKIGIWNYSIFSIFVILNSIIGNPITIQSLAAPLILLVTAGICMSTIGALQYFQNRYHRKIERLLTRDELTGLYNRRFLKASVSKEIKTKNSFALVIIDINFFKHYNDFWGHTAGDSLLISIAKLLTKNVRPQDIVVRHSGDEFIIMLPGSERALVEKTIATIIQAIESYNFPGEECFPNHKLSISYGFAFFPSEARNYRDLFTAADKELYRYKKAHSQ